VVIVNLVVVGVEGISEKLSSEFCDAITRFLSRDRIMVIMNLYLS